MIDQQNKIKAKCIHVHSRRQSIHKEGARHRFCERAHVSQKLVPMSRPLTIRDNFSHFLRSLECDLLLSSLLGGGERLYRSRSLSPSLPEPFMPRRLSLSLSLSLSRSRSLESSLGLLRSSPILISRSFTIWGGGDLPYRDRGGGERSL